MMLWRPFLRNAAAMLAVLAAHGLPAGAQEAPGKVQEAPGKVQEAPGRGRTVRYAQGDSLGANYVTAQIVMRAMRELGYGVKLTTLNTTLFFQAAAQGDLDLATDVNFPQREPGFRAVEKQATTVGTGLIASGGVNGYLIDRKTAAAHAITSLEQLREPRLAALFGKNGQADLINCDPGWSCGDVVDFQLGKFGLKDTVRSVRGKYEALMVEAVARVKRGEPALFYAWSPSWVTNALIPGEDVVWLPTPEDALPPNVPNRGSALVSGVKGCAGGADPCRMAMASWNWMAVANREFLAANPAIRVLIEGMTFPLATWTGWEYNINKGGGSTALVTKLADAWIAANRPQFDGWIAAAARAR
ncbi:Glycine betaine-binding periplasmic protein OusX [Methylobacterium crusticola]|uniref:Glycine betaine-binding periplasmic protein OusX n=1 Tax=Methylobacterium crusticola TaxID=1697972 RepID=A0ABQ4QVZ4_9HYPH|nr:glycine betaine/L-proline ABC transporter substrate-binding protein ProX [Methylobacterium crusticola]GJD49352.1 Glycine betaine-binding periplasmic protein OusX [Methylobacterium crusticola]